jgi:uncharacterized membrane protein YdbT with pleckstrin-like domain
MDAEEVVVHRHPHVRVLFRPVLVAVSILGVAGVLVALAPQTSTRLGLVAATLLLVAIAVSRRLLHWLTTTLTVTDRRLLLRSGVLSRYGRDIPLARIVEVSFEHTLFERMLGAGTLYVELGSGRGMVVVQNVPRVEDVHSAIYELLEDDEEHEDEEELWDEEPAPGRRWLRRRESTS